MRERFLVMAGLILAAAGTGSLAQEESCASALQSRVKAGEAILATLPRLDTGCSELKRDLDAFAAAEAALTKSYRAVRRACPAGEFVRADTDIAARSQFILDAIKRKLANCPDAVGK